MGRTTAATLSMFVWFCMSNGEMPVLSANKSELFDCSVAAMGGSSRLRGACANESSNSSQRQLGDEGKQN
jgi:hypothetical protein